MEAEELLEVVTEYSQLDKKNWGRQDKFAFRARGVRILT